MLEIITVRAFDCQHAFFIDRGAFAWDLDLFFAAQIHAGERGRIGLDLFGCALCHDLSAMHTGAGTDIDYMIGHHDRLFIVFHHDNSIAQVTQVSEGTQQAGIVALMQANGRFIQDVHHADQTGADLTGQAYALCLTTG